MGSHLFRRHDRRRVRSTPERRVNAKRGPSSIGARAPVADKVMGPLSELARHVSAGLQDPAVRGRVVRAMKDSAMGRNGLDLTACDATELFGAVFTAAERRGGRSGGLLCSNIREARGLILYMDRDRLAGWDSTTIPIVTAVADPTQAMPNSFVGYRSPLQTIDLPRDGSVGGPILVILPYLHHRRFAFQPAKLLPSHALRVNGPSRDSLTDERRPDQ